MHELWDDYGVVNIRFVLYLFLLHFFINISTPQPFTMHFPQANIHEMMSPDLLHQVIKGAFKDHIIEWIQQWLVKTHGEVHANKILEDIDHW